MKPYNSGKSKKEEVQQMFDNLAPTYDSLNHLFSLSIDKMWRRRVMRKVRRMKPQRILDLATGTGDLAILMAKRIPQAKIMGVDLSEKMLAVAAEKIRRQGLDDHIALYQGDAENLELESGMIDVVTISFGIRNFSDMDKSLREIWRVVAPGGHLVVVELTMPSNPLVRKAYKFYSNHIMTPVGGMLSHDRKAFDYLPNSIAAFPKTKEFLKMMESAGFEHCRNYSQSLGIAQIFVGRKPE
jgi:demethylmenaquinone methyltransferase/2-methoxy-6-polyprenyl-1,4-benzoquinol methylase